MVRPHSLRSRRRALGKEEGGLPPAGAAAPGPRRRAPCTPRGTPPCTPPLLPEPATKSPRQDLGRQPLVIATHRRAVRTDGQDRCVELCAIEQALKGLERPSLGKREGSDRRGGSDPAGPERPSAARPRSPRGCPGSSAARARTERSEAHSVPLTASDSATPSHLDGGQARREQFPSWLGTPARRGLIEQVLDAG